MKFRAEVLIEIVPEDAKVELDAIPDFIENKLADSLKYVEGVVECRVRKLEQLG